MKAIWAIAHGVIKELIRKKDFYVLLIFMLVLLGFLSYQTFFQIEGISRYVRDFGYSLVMLFSFIIAVTFTAKQIPSEIGARTIYPLLAKPLSRQKIILGKFLGGTMVSVISFTVFYLIFVGFYMTGGEGKSLVLLGQGFIFGILFLCMVSALVMFFSNFMTLSANITSTFLIYIAMGSVSEALKSNALFFKGIISGLYGFLYYLLPHFEFFDLRIRITHAWDALPLWVVFSVSGYTFLYCFVLLYFSGYVFGRKRF
ncbi:MAG: ABC transporter permease subunit [Candidatus Aadella gelida]|nr:ABC transporter permease subunit [Candidatus Aadella gelida]